MNTRQLILLSPYRLPTETTLYLGDEEVAAILEGHQVLWHPAALLFGTGLPRLAQPYDHEEPQGDAIYVVTDNPSLMLPEDWRERARAAGAILIDAFPDREATLESLRTVLREAFPENEQLRQLLDLPVEKARPFQGIGLSILILDALFEAMSHDNVIPLQDIRQDLDQAIAQLSSDDPEAWRQPLVAAAERLLSAREVLYPVSIYLVDLFLVDPDKPAVGWPAAFEADLPLNIIASGQLVERLAQEHPDKLDNLRARVESDLVEILGSVYREREDPLLPLETQLWNLRHAQEVYRNLLGREARVFARRQSGFHPQSPLLLQHSGYTHCLFLSFDDGLLPSQHSIVVSWPSHNGKQVDAFTRSPQPASSYQTYFHLAHYLHQTIMQDQSATFVLLHKGDSSCSLYQDWIELTRLAPILGRWVTLTSYFNEVVPGDYTSAISPDEFQTDYLSDRTLGSGPERTRPISEFPELARARRRLDAAWTFFTIGRTLRVDTSDLNGKPFLEGLAQLEDQFERGEVLPPDALPDAQQKAAEPLAQRLVARGPADSPGWLMLNPCSFTRRVALELSGLTRPVPSGGPVKACQIDGDLARLVVEVPPLGFAWVPKEPASGPALPARMRLADEHAVRNEFFEAEIDPQTGGLRALRDQRQRITRVAQQLVYNPGSSMRATKIEVISSGPALGEIVTHGVLVDESGTELAEFHQRFRAWLGRPMLEMRIDIEPRKPVEGYAWHSYFAARFAWRDEMTSLVRSSTGLRSLTSQNRPESPDFVELRHGRHNTVLFPGGLPFHQRHGSRMIDVLLLCEGEQARSFDLGIGIDREAPLQTALGLISPVAVVPTTQGPPHIGAAGWLYHLDAPNVLLTSLRPTPDHPDAILATMLECTGAGGPAQFRCLRDPVRAVLQDLQGSTLFDAMLQGDAVDFDLGANDLLRLRVEFS